MGVIMIMVAAACSYAVARSDDCIYQSSCTPYIACDEATECTSPGSDCYWCSSSATQSTCSYNPLGVCCQSVTSGGCGTATEGTCSVSGQCVQNLSQPNPPRSCNRLTC